MFGKRSDDNRTKTGGPVPGQPGPAPAALNAPQAAIPDLPMPGQSFGGLAALYAALHWPERFGCALSQSGSFWWPQRGAPGRLFEALASGRGSTHPLRLFIEAGLREPAILEASRALVPRLREQGHVLDYREIDGGHDALWWRGGLLDGLVQLWRPRVTADAQR